MHFVAPERDVRVSLVGGRGHYERVIDEVLHADVSVWIATANLKSLMIEAPGRRRRYETMLSALASLSRRGIDLRILHSELPSRPFREAFDAEPDLVEGGLELRMCPRVHFKTVIVDGRFLYLGSANWTGAGLGVRSEHKRNFELGIVTEDESMLDDVQAMYEEVWRGRPCKTCRLRGECDAPLDDPM